MDKIEDVNTLFPLLATSHSKQGNGGRLDFESSMTYHLGSRKYGRPYSKDKILVFSLLNLISNGGNMNVMDLIIPLIIEVMPISLHSYLLKLTYQTQF